MSTFLPTFHYLILSTWNSEETFSFSLKFHSNFIHTNESYTDNSMIPLCYQDEHECMTVHWFSKLPLKIKFAIGRVENRWIDVFIH